MIVSQESSESAHPAQAGSGLTPHSWLVCQLTLPFFISVVDSGDADFAVAVISVTPERKAEYNMVYPFYYR
jgi:hypothetical protein